MSQLMIFPWIDREEVKKVYKELFSRSVARQKHALGRMEVWMARAQHKLPMACESTAALVSANLEFQQAGATAQKESNIAVLYSLALVRFVNHVTGKGQSKTFAVPIHRLAKELGIPEWIVDLRHSIVHGNLPSISILRAAANWSLNWLKLEFWEKQIIKPEVGPSPYLQTIAALQENLVQYQQQKFREMKDKLPVESRLLGELEKQIDYLGPGACPCLTGEGYLIMTPDQLQALGIDVNAFVTSGSTLPKAITVFWQKLFKILLRNNIIPALVLHLVSIVTEEACLSNKLVCCWLNCLLRQCASGGNLVSSGVLLPWKQILEKCLQLRGPYSIRIVTKVLEVMDKDVLFKDQKQQLKKLVQLYNSDSSQLTTDDSDKIFSTQDIQPDSCQNNPWAVCKKQIDWSNCPLGRLPNQFIGYRTLEVIVAQDPNEPVECCDDTELAEDDEEEMCWETRESEVDPVLEMQSLWHTGQGDNGHWTKEAVKLISTNIYIF